MVVGIADGYHSPLTAREASELTTHSYRVGTCDTDISQSKKAASET